MHLADPQPFRAQQPQDGLIHRLEKPEILFGTCPVPGAPVDLGVAAVAEVGREVMGFVARAFAMPEGVAVAGHHLAHVGGVADHAPRGFLGGLEQGFVAVGFHFSLASPEGLGLS